MQEVLYKDRNGRTVQSGDKIAIIESHMDALVFKGDEFTIFTNEKRELAVRRSTLLQELPSEVYEKIV